MKKISVVALVLVLSFALVGCLGVSEDEGVGKLILNSDVTVTDADANPESEAPVVMIDDEEYSFGEAINLKSGKHEVTIMEEIDGMTYGTIIEDVVVERGKTTMYEDGIDLPVAQGTLHIEFDPSEHEDLLGEYDLSDNIVVRVIGKDINGSWEPSDTQKLEKEDGIHKYSFEDVTVGNKYKLVVISEDADEDWVNGDLSADWWELVNGQQINIGMEDGDYKADGSNIEVGFDDLEI